MSQDRAAAFHLAAHVLYRGLLPESESTRAELAAALRPGSAARASASAAWPGQSRGSAAPTRPSGPCRRTLPPPQRCLGVSPEPRSPRDRVPRSCLQGNARRGINSEMGERGAGSAGRNHTYVEKGEAKEEVKACCYFLVFVVSL